MHLRCLLFPVLAGSMLLPAAHAADPIASGSLSCASPGVVDWTASANDVDGDLITLTARVLSYATEADCLSDSNLLRSVEVHDGASALGTSSLWGSGWLNATEGTWCKLLVEATDDAGGDDAFSVGCCQVSADPDIQVLVRAGDSVPGVGLVTAIDDVGVCNDGNTIVRVTTDNADWLADTVVLRNGQQVLRESQPLNGPGATILKSFESISLNARMHPVWGLFLDGMGSGGTYYESGIYFGGNPIALAGTPTTAPQFSPVNELYGVYQCAVNANDQVLYNAIVKDPATPEFSNQSAIIANVDADGQLVSEQLVIRQGAYMPGALEKVEGWGIETLWWSFNALGQFMFVANEEGLSAFDRACYVGGTEVEREGYASPVPGRPWASLAGAELDLNDLGDWVLHGEIEGDSDSDFIIVRNGQLFVQEGDPAPIPGFVFQRFGLTSPVMIGNTGNVLWFGDWSDPDTSRDTGLFLNETLILQEGVSTVGGELIEFIRGVIFGYLLSPDGEWIVIEVELQGGVNAALLYHVGPWTYLDNALAGTGGVAPRLHGRGSVQDASLIRLELSHARPNTTAALVLGVSELSAPFRGGTMVPNPDVLFLGLPVNAQGELTISFAFPSGVPPGVPVWYQYWPSDPEGPVGYSASNAVKSTTP